MLLRKILAPLPQKGFWVELPTPSEEFPMTFFGVCMDISYLGLSIIQPSKFIMLIHAACHEARNEWEY